MTLKDLSKFLTLDLELFKPVHVSFERVDELLVISKAVDELLNAFDDYLKVGEELAEHMGSFLSQVQ